MPKLYLLTITVGVGVIYIYIICMAVHTCVRACVGACLRVWCFWCVAYVLMCLCAHVRMDAWT